MSPDAGEEPDPLLDRLVPFHCITDERQIITSCGPSLAKVTGGDPLGRAWVDLFTAPERMTSPSAPEFDRWLGQLLIAEVKQSGLRLRGEVLRQPGRSWLFAWSPWIASAAEFSGTGLTLMDFSVHDPMMDMLHVMNALERARLEASAPLERIRRFFQVSSDLMFLLDSQGRILEANGQVTATTGMASDALRTMSVTDLLEDSAQPVWGEALERLQQGVQVDGVSMTLRSGSGGSRTTEWSATPDLDRGLIYATARDVSEEVAARRQLEQELTSARDAAIALARTKDELLANTSHELRTPLTAILGLADLLRESDLTVDQAEVVDTAHVAADRLLALVDDFLSYAKGEAEVLDLDEAPFSPAEVVEECGRIVSERCRTTGTELRVRISPTTPGSVLGDREKVRTTVMNLLDNAIKFGAGGTVTLEVDGTDDGLRIEVSDTGIGIPQEMLGTVFEPFAQVDASKTRQYGGSGLGLAITRQLVATMRGTVSVTSTPGSGSTFTLEVPAPRVTSPAPTGSPSSSGGTPLLGLRVLLAEDDSVNYTLIIRMLQRLGATVTWVPDGAQAVDRAMGAEQFDVMLMDVQMPLMDGLAATRAIRSHGVRSRTGAPLPILALTAGAMDGDEANCRAAGMDAFMAKPVKLSQFPTVLGPYLPG